MAAKGPRHLAPMRAMALLAMLSPLGTACAALSRPLSTTPMSSPPPPTTAPPPAPSATPTPPPTAARMRTPTPAAGPILFEETFDRPGKWDLSPDGSGGASLLQGRLVIALREPRTFRRLLVPFQPPSDYQIQVQVLPQLCAPDDEFGLLLRLNSAGEHYQVALSCRGELIVRRVLMQGTLALLPRQVRPEILAGPLRENRLLVRLAGESLEIWANDLLLASLRDSALAGGETALFIRTGRDSQLTVSFDNLVIRALPPTAIPSPTPRGAP